jgi:MinD superfamily P-loop ATPase
MIITIASGKGGTGKTTVATSLALSLVRYQPEQPCLFLDCDVEAPNAHLFLRPFIDQRQEVSLLIPSIDEVKCTHCGRCAEVCQYHAIAVLGKKTLVFPQLCHGCGSCTALCPEAAISEVPERMGVIERGTAVEGISFARGVLDLGEPMAVPIIHQLLAWAQPSPGRVVLRDAPPGTSCPVVAAARGGDFLLLVTEPTPFGLHDLRLATQIARELHIPTGVVINRDNGAFPDLESFCAAEDLPVLMRIPFERSIAEGIAQGRTLVEIQPEYIGYFQQVFAHISNVVQGKQLG